MKVLFPYILFCFFSMGLFGQNKEETISVDKTNSLFTKETSLFYSKFFYEFKINEHLNFRFEKHKYNTEEHVLYEFPLLLKYNYKDKLNLLFGPRLDVLKSNTTGRYKNVSLYSVFGIDKNVTKDFSMEASFNYRLQGKSPPPEFYSSGGRGSFKFGSNIKL